MVNAMAHFYVQDVLSGFCSRRILSTCVHAGNAAGAWMRRSSDPRYGLFFIALLLLSSFVSAESLREYHQRQCDEGKAESCQRAIAMLEGEQHADRIVELGDNFAEKLDRSIMDEENKPRLKKAYIDVLDDYFTAESEKGVKRLVARDMLNLCAEHYHNHWRNRKMVWPTNEAGQPDWSTIYYYVVEHYYGYCLRSVQ